MDPIAVDFETRVRVAGETIYGNIHINHALAKEDKLEQVIVKLIGFIKTYANPSHSRHATHRFLFSCGSVPSLLVVATQERHTGRRSHL